MPSYYFEPPYLIVNFKTYSPEGVGKKAYELAKILEKAANEYGVTIIPVPANIDLTKIVEEINLPIFAQHADPFEQGSYTGFQPIMPLKEIGVTGTLLNHSEHPIGFTKLEKTLDLLNREKIMACVCAASPLLSKAAASLEPWAVAMEPPELIGGDVSVTTQPEIVKETVRLVDEVTKETLVLCGAGVKTDEHVKGALDLGTLGVLLASGVVKAANQEEVVQKMAKAMVEWKEKNN
ncbi:MAG: triosephosphate isomerase [Candidatus Heimdallarchaeota archaeon]|nr:triosephosphate isomerase [Candidatus Heimdallarchaeota archaeon]MCK5050020.1 triosephosphate isomerase [Candidatus Heimdallarchaeota archaeon]